VSGDTYNTKITMKDADTWTLDGCTDAGVCAKRVLRVNDLRRRDLQARAFAGAASGAATGFILPDKLRLAVAPSRRH
jgi:hypothetical protein